MSSVKQSQDESFLQKTSLTANIAPSGLFVYEGIIACMIDGDLADFSISR